MSSNNLPSQPTPFIGRDEELAEIARLLGDPSCRLLTLVGPGGIGKTRLAIQAALQTTSVIPASEQPSASQQPSASEQPSDSQQPPAFTDGVFYIPLQPLSSIDYLVPAIAEALNFSFSGQVNPQDQLLGFLKDKQMLLVMDNFEHLLEGAGLLPRILEAAPGKILVTSREVLGLQEEWIRPVHGLRYPEGDGLHQVEDFSAVRLFSERARRVNAGFSLAREQACVVRICQLVQGMPLAIELAAAWLKTLPCPEIVSEIQHGLNFLATTLRNVPERHRNVRAVFEQSWKLLAAPEQDVFKKLAVFQGGFTREAAHAVAGASLHTLQALIDKSLLQITPSGRYQIHELLRQFALEILGERTPELIQAQYQHCSYFADFLDSREARLKGPDQIQALTEIDAEIDNMRVAWRWAVEQAKEAEICKSMGGLLLYYQMRTRPQEGAEAFNRALRKFESLGGEVLGVICVSAAWFNAIAGAASQAALQYQKAFALLRGRPLQGTTAIAFSGIVFLEYLNEKLWDVAEVHQSFQENLSHCLQAGDRWEAAWMLYGLGNIASQSGQPEEARQRLQESVELFRATGDRWGSTWALNKLGAVAADLGAYAEAQEIFQESLLICQEIGDWGGVAHSLGELGGIAVIQQEYRSSWQYLSDAVKIAYKMHRDLDTYWNLVRIAWLLRTAGQLERSVELLSFLLVYPSYPWGQNYSKKMLRELEGELPPEVYSRAARRWQGSRLDAVIEEFSSAYFQGQDGPGANASPSQVGSASGDLTLKDSSLLEPLSGRELEVLGFIAAGLSNRDIAQKLVVTVGTVKKHINNIFGKLGVRSRTQAVARARELKLL